MVGVGAGGKGGGVSGSGFRLWGLGGGSSGRCFVLFCAVLFLNLGSITALLIFQYGSIAFQAFLCNPGRAVSSYPNFGSEPL